MSVSERPNKLPKVPQYNLPDFKPIRHIKTKTKRQFYNITQTANKRRRRTKIKDKHLFNEIYDNEAFIRSIRNEV